jgi:hypothetical protein
MSKWVASWMGGSPDRHAGDRRLQVAAIEFRRDRPNGPVDRLKAVLRMVPLYPRLHEPVELVRLLHEVFGLRLRRDVRHIVIDLVPLPPAGLEIRSERRRLSAHRDFEGPERCLMVAETDDPVAFAGDHHGCELQDGIVRSGEAPVSRELRNLCVQQIPLDDGVESAQLG